MILTLMVRTPSATPYLQASFGGATFWFRGSISADVKPEQNAETAFQAKMNVLALMLADEIPVNLLPV